MSESCFQPFGPGTVFSGRYCVVGAISAGGMGAVYEVLDQKTQRPRALKIMHPSLSLDPDLRARFHDEARIAAPIRSDHIVEVLDAGIDESTALPFLVMELLEGEDMGLLLRRRGTLGASEVVGLLHQASLALDRTHAAGIVHRDLKPENLFVSRRDDGSAHVKVLDFGIAKVVAQSAAAKTTRNVGTPLYMSPEQIRGDGRIGPAADLYSLGQIAFALLTGEPYWAPEARDAGSYYALCSRLVKGLPEPATNRAASRGVELPPGFDPWFLKTSADDPSERFGTASELVRELALALCVTLGQPQARIGNGTGGQAPEAYAPTLRSEKAPEGGSFDPRLRAVRVDSTAPCSSTKHRATHPLRPWGAVLASATVAGVGILLYVTLLPLGSDARRATAPHPHSSLAPTTTRASGDSVPASSSSSRAAHSSQRATSLRGVGSPGLASPTGVSAAATPATGDRSSAQNTRTTPVQGTTRPPGASRPAVPKGGAESRPPARSAANSNAAESASAPSTPPSVVGRRPNPQTAASVTNSQTEHASGTTPIVYVP